MRPGYDQKRVSKIDRSHQRNIEEKDPFRDQYDSHLLPRLARATVSSSPVVQWPRLVVASALSGAASLVEPPVFASSNQRLDLLLICRNRRALP